MIGDSRGRSRNRTRRESWLAGNPVLIGSFTVLVAVVAVVLAYNATNGLPFVPTYGLHVQAADASELTKGNDVYLGGSRVGVVSSVVPVRTTAGRPIALVNINLQKSIEPLPVDTTFTVRLKGAIGLKYLQINPGRSSRGFANGATVPMRQMSTEVDFDQVLSMFNPPTRVAVQRTTIGFAEALAGRGYDINNAIGAFLPLVRDLGPVMRNLASPRTDLAGFFRGLGSYVGALAPVAQTQASLFTNLNTTFRALAGVAVPALQDTISQTPPNFEATITGSPIIRPFLTDTAALFSELRPGAATLPQTAPVLADAFAQGTKNLPGTAALDRRTVALAQSVDRYGRNPAVQQGLDRLTLTLSKLGPPLAFLTPAQTTCNYVTLFLRNTSSLLSEHVSQGTLLRFVQIAIDDIPGAESEPSSHVYQGPVGNASAPLHVNPYPYTAAPGQPAACAAGNEPYTAGHVAIGNPSGHLSLKTETTHGSGG
ncbi:MAG TPA: MlaD family protein [Solirubrobacteraceae bacterium]|nr:MlaD family protein [Solirubrobacteraceae bacterium]